MPFSRGLKYQGTFRLEGPTGPWRRSGSEKSDPPQGAGAAQQVVELRELGGLQRLAEMQAGAPAAPRQKNQKPRSDGAPVVPILLPSLFGG